MIFSSLEGFFWSKWLSKFINRCVFKGKKYLVEKILYFSFFLLKKRLNKCAIFFFFEALECVKPVVGLKLYTLRKRKVKKITAVPYIASVSLQYKKAIFWLMSSIKLRKEKTWSIRLFQEFYDLILNKTGASFLKKKEFYKYVILFKTTKKFKW